MKLWKWWLAISTNRMVWRVTYKDGNRTHVLPYAEAKGLKDCFGGKLWIDYDKGYF